MNLRIISANLVVKLTSFYREKSAMLFTIAFPIILILVFGTIFMSQDNVSYHLCVQDLDQTNSSAQAVKTLELSGTFKITRVDPAVNATRYVIDNQVNLVLIIPKGYESSLMQRMTLNDFNANLPFCSSAFMFQQNLENMSLKQLAPMLKIPLATVDSSIRWMQLLYCVPVLYTPGKNILFKNVGRAQGYVGAP